MAWCLSWSNFAECSETNTPTVSLSDGFQRSYGHFCLDPPFLGPPCIIFSCDIFSAHWPPSMDWFDQLENHIHHYQFRNIFMGFLQYKVDWKHTYFYILYDDLIARNRDKNNSLTGKSVFVLMTKIVCDCVSRILLFSAWLYVVHNGQFSTLRTLAAYYVTFLIMFIFNIIFNRSKNFRSAKYWIGTCT